MEREKQMSEYLCTNKVIVHVVAVICFPMYVVTAYINKVSGHLTQSSPSDSLVSMNSNDAIKFIVKINFTNLLFYL